MSQLDQAPGISVDESPAERADMSRQHGGNGPGAPSVNVANVERAVSVAIGAIIIAKGLSRLSIPALLIAGAGAALINRGVTGYCGVYKKMGVDTASA